MIEIHLSELVWKTNSLYNWSSCNSSSPIIYSFIHLFKREITINSLAYTMTKQEEVAVKYCVHIYRLKYTFQ